MMIFKVMTSFLSNNLLCSCDIQYRKKRINYLILLTKYLIASMFYEADQILGRGGYVHCLKSLAFFGFWVQNWVTFIS